MSGLWILDMAHPLMNNLMNNTSSCLFEKENGS